MRSVGTRRRCTPTWTLSIRVPSGRQKVRPGVLVPMMVSRTGSASHANRADFVGGGGAPRVGDTAVYAGCVDVVLQYFDDCPNWRAVDDHLRALVREFTDVVVTRHLVDTPEEADRVGFRGSPTILVDGVDPFVTESDPVGGLSCRIYETPDGPAGSPTLEQLRRVISARK